MCGIVGIAGFRDEGLVRRMCGAIAHRGPDDEGFHFDESVSLGMRRLSIIDLATGKRKWKAGRYQHGQVLLAGDLLIVQAEGGDVALVHADPGKLLELGRISALSGKTWNNPALAGRFLLVRNDHEAACYELPGATD